MAGDYGKGQGGKQSISSTEAPTKTSGTPKTGFNEAPKSKELRGGPGPGVPASQRKIH